MTTERDNTVDTIFPRRKTFWIVFVAAFLIFFAHNRSFLLLFDGLTYSALAKHILTSGDWTVLHYGREQYPDFYQHPPLAVWLQALIYKIFGASSDSIARILPSTLCVFTVMGVYLFSRARLGASAAFWSAVALLTSTRFIKWGSNFYLDGIFAFFAFSSFALWLYVLGLYVCETKREKKFLFSFLAGCLLAGAFMTKGVVSVAVLVLCVFASFFYFSFPLLLVFLFGVFFPIALWMGIGNGGDYIRKYYEYNVLTRAQPGFEIAAWKNLFTIWWPWIPVFIFGLGFAIRSFLKKQPLLLLFSLAALSFPVGFSLGGGGFLEHYLTPFYPFAAIVVGAQLSQWFEAWPKMKPLSHHPQLVRNFSLVIFSAAVFLATISPDVNAQKEVPAVKWIRAIRLLDSKNQAKIEQIVFTQKSGELWLNLATLLARTDWQAIGEFALDRPILPRTILIAASDEKVPEGWKRLDCLSIPKTRFYAPKGESLCDNE